jgi:ATP-dependent RecD-like DNA helicase SH3 domain
LRPAGQGPGPPLELITWVGHAAAISTGEWITASGDWVNDRTRGQHGARKVERFGWTFAPGDKVMQIENDYDKEVYKGDIGYVVDVVDVAATPNGRLALPAEERGKCRAVLRSAASGSAVILDKAG